MIIRKRFKVAIIVLLALYAVVFAVRFAYDLVTLDDEYPWEYPITFANSGMLASERKNVVSMTTASYDIDTGSIGILEQIYEQSAWVGTKTTAFDDDFAKLNVAIKEAQAMVQAETAQGLAGRRTLSVVIGVTPQYFDSCLDAVKEIGTVTSLVSQKNDKTNEYRQMLVRKQELEKRLENYISLREYGGTIQEMINLEDKIIEVESMLLRQAADLGEYSDDNSLCTIYASLREEYTVHASVAQAAWHAFVWTNKCYLGILGGIILSCLTGAVLVKAYIFLGGVLALDSKKKLENTDSERG